jgi:hypothetical protein
MKFTQISSFTQESTQTSRAANSSGLGGDAVNLTSTYKIMDMKAWLVMTSYLYCFRESKPRDDEDDHRIDRVREYELVEPEN